MMVIFYDDVSQAANIMPCKKQTEAYRNWVFK